MPRRAAPDPVDALALRGWALSILLGPGPGPAVPDELAGCSPAAWARFLGIERCALPLRAALTAGGASASLPPATARTLESAAMRELQRNLSARARLQMLGRMAEEHGWRLVALKGGVAAAAGTQLDLLDVDVLARPAEAGALDAMLDTRGYARYRTWSQAHLAPRFEPDAVAIEIHHTISFLDDVAGFIERAVPLNGVAGLRAPDPADHLWHLLVHSVVHHPERRGRIRDLLLIRLAADACGPAGLRTVERRVRDHAAAPLLHATLAMALDDGRTGEPADRFARTNRDKYFALCRPLPLLRGLARDRVLVIAPRIMVAPGSLRQEIRRMQEQSLLGDSPIGAIVWLERRAPRLGVALRQGIRAGYVTLAYILARTALRRARRTLPDVADRVGPRMDRADSVPAGGAERASEQPSP